MKNTAKSVNFEKSLEQLEALVNRLEKGGLSLEESLKCFEQGVKLTRECRQALQSAEQKISVLSKENGDWVEKNFDHGEMVEKD
ncbi:MAG: exodeoxyribonuclease VII small subunit [Gammaproteobacteria bacterium]|nr:exodeoxyribonuclease VII small subunit [Gammaproteobacteria bacterium]